MNWPQEVYCREKQRAGAVTGGPFDLISPSGSVDRNLAGGVVMALIRCLKRFFKCEAWR